MAVSGQECLLTFEDEEAVLARDRKDLASAVERGGRSCGVAAKLQTDDVSAESKRSGRRCPRRSAITYRYRVERLWLGLGFRPVVKDGAE